MTSLPEALKSCKVYTPKPLASAMVSRLGDREGISWLEPCVGGGVFLEVLNVQGVSKSRIRAIDLDPRKASADRFAHTTRGSDFLAWCYETHERFDRVVGNPPFLRLNKLPIPLLQSALMVKDPFGAGIQLKSNCWYAFLCATLHVLAPGGSLGFVLPASWEFSDYARGLRSGVQALFQTVEVHRSRRPIFDTVQDGSVVLIAEGFRQPLQKVVRIQHSTPHDLIVGLRSGLTTRHLPRFRLPQPSRGLTCALGDVMDVRIGAVTGNASYFLLTDAQRKSLKLPVSSVRPILSKARHLITAEMSKRTFKKLRSRGERIWLLYPTPRTRNLKHVRAYLRRPPSRGGCSKRIFKIRERKIWYQTPLPIRGDGFISGMTSSGPWISFSVMPRLTASNTLYVVRFHRPIARPLKFAWALSLLTSVSRHALESNRRLYAQGLGKLEPGDLSRLIIPVPVKTRGAINV